MKCGGNGFSVGKDTAGQAYDIEHLLNGESCSKGTQHLDKTIKFMNEFCTVQSSFRFFYHSFHVV